MKLELLYRSDSKKRVKGLVWWIAFTLAGILFIPHALAIPSTLAAPSQMKPRKISAVVSKQLRLIEAGDSTARDLAASRLIQIGLPAIPQLMEFARDGYRTLAARYVAVEILGRMGIVGMKALTELARDSKALVRVKDYALRMLSKTREGKEMLLQVMSDSDKEQYLRAGAVRALGRVQEKTLVPHFLKIVENPSNPLVVRYQAIIALGKTKSPEAIPALQHVLSDPTEDKFLRREAAIALGRMDDTLAESALKSSVSAIAVHDEEGLRAVLNALSDIYYRQLRRELNRWHFSLEGAEGTSLGVEVEVGNYSENKQEIRTPPTNQHGELKKWLEEIQRELVEIYRLGVFEYSWSFHLNIGLEHEEAKRIIDPGKNVMKLRNGELVYHVREGVANFIHLLMYPNNSLDRNRYLLGWLYSKVPFLGIHFYIDFAQPPKGRSEVGRLEIKECSIGPLVDVDYLLWAGRFLKEILSSSDSRQRRRLAEKMMRIYRDEGLYLTGKSDVETDEANLERIWREEIELYYWRCQRVRGRIVLEMEQWLRERQGRQDQALARQM